MGIPRPFEPVILFCGSIFKDEAIFFQAKHRLQKNFSAVIAETPAIPFTFTDYYQPEMGTPLFRRFLAFSQGISPEMLPQIKLLTNAIERELALAGKRQINLDPGYVSAANVVIATCKNFSHRIPLAAGIYAHLEYVCRKGHPEVLPWTYPDFRSEAYLEFFRGVLALTKKERGGSLRFPLNDDK